MLRPVVSGLNSWAQSANYRPLATFHTITALFRGDWATVSPQFDTLPTLLMTFEQSISMRWVIPCKRRSFLADMRNFCHKKRSLTHPKSGSQLSKAFGIINTVYIHMKITWKQSPYSLAFEACVRLSSHNNVWLLEIPDSWSTLFLSRRTP